MNINFSVRDVILLIVWGVLLSAIIAFSPNLSSITHFIGGMVGGISIGLGLFGAKIILSDNGDNDDNDSDE